MLFGASSKKRTILLAEASDSWVFLILILCLSYLQSQMIGQAYLRGQLHSMWSSEDELVAIIASLKLALN